MAFRNALSVLILVSVGLVLVAQQKEDVNGKSGKFLRPRGRQLPLDPRTIDVKPQVPRGSVAVVISTPKCGTGGLAGSFAQSFEPCLPVTRPFPSTVLFDCEEEKHAVKSHNVNAGAELIESFRSQHPIEKCLVVTAIRDPQTWIPSMFMESRRDELCNANIASTDEMIKIYREWVATHGSRLREAAQVIRPRLLAEFGASSLTDEMKKVDANGGYSILDKAAPDGPFGHCELLFLKVENSDKWPDFISSVMPGVVYHKGSSREELCPHIADQYEAIKNYPLSQEERAGIVNDDPDTAEYFKVYGYL
mmetsp:Transcript_8870/g.13620  ORF Transcript_8870/g.13620 Transcript_8870/m.13620 type:complete len:307 (-) Transcript_8870:108-1028(-)